VVDQIDPSARQGLVRDVNPMSVQRFAKSLQNSFLSVPHCTAPAKQHGVHALALTLRFNVPSRRRGIQLEAA
jgi:hypothetical protein